MKKIKQQIKHILFILAIWIGSTATAENLMPYYDALYVDCDGIFTCYTLESRPKISFENVEHCVLTFGMDSKCQSTSPNEIIKEEESEIGNGEAQKVLINDRIYIIRDEKTFDLYGTEVDVE